MSPATSINACVALAVRELIHIRRQPSRIVATVATPVVVWVFLAGGFGSWFAAGGGTETYSAYLIPGMATMAVLFSSVFGAITLIDDRHAGFLQTALVSPAPRWAIAGGKVVAGGLVATLQGGVMLLAGPIVGVEAGPGGYLAALALLALVACTLTALGLSLAWWIDSTQGFHGVMNLLLMPMWLLSGAFFPLERAAGWLGLVMHVNPLGWANRALQWSLGTWSGAGPADAAMTVVICLVIIAVSFALIGRVSLRPRRP